jgi:hypothetical protein
MITPTVTTVTVFFNFFFFFFLRKETNGSDFERVYITWGHGAHTAFCPSVGGGEHYRVGSSSQDPAATESS